jgi:sugar transferase (PEP-CTERM system associated)
MAQILMQRVTWRTVTPIVFESGVVLASVLTSASLVLGRPAAVIVSDPTFLLKVALVAAVSHLCLYFDDLYDLRRVANPLDFTIGLVRSLGVTSLLLAALYLLFPGLSVGRSVFVLGVLLALVGLATLDMVFVWLISRLGPRERVLLVGTKPAALELARELNDRRLSLGVEVVGFVEAENTATRTFVPKPGVVGRAADIQEIVERLSVDRVVVSLADARGKLPMNHLLNMKLRGIRFDHLASVYEEFTGKIAIENLRPSWLIFSDGFRKPRMLVIGKRAIDIAVSGIGLALTLPLLLVVGVAVRLSSAGPALYHQRRTGLHGRPFMVHKFRTMRQDAEAKTGAVWAAEQDPRVTALGGFLRRTRLDELPQLWNVLRGDMSLVGPRPERPEFVETLTADVPFYGQRHVVKPGVTGWAQIRYAYGASVEDAMEKLQYDLFYVKNVSLLLDLFIMFSTLKIVLLRRGAR